MQARTRVINYLDEFLKQHYTLLTHSVEILAAITGLFCYGKYKSTPVKYFICFLVYVAIIELVGSYPGYVAKYGFLKEAKAFLKGTKFERNYWFFTIFWIIGSALFYGLYFREILKSKFFKKILKYLILLFLVFSIGYIALYWSLFFTGRTILIDIFGVIIIMLGIIFYLVEILRSDKILRFYKSIDFYIAAILIIWYIIVTPLSFYSIYFTKADWSFVMLKYQIHLLANICMYLSFAFALLWCNPKTNQ
ncbi:MAG: hypothetical protein R2783_01375 [Gelidibacter sp.]